MFDVVDRNDIPTGELVDKKNAHENEVLHRCAAVFVFDADGELYVQPHVKTGGKLDNTVGGHVSSGENYEHAAYREMDEEIGLSNTELETVDLGYISNDGRGHVFGIFECVAPVDWVFVPNDEVHELKKMKLKTITEQMNAAPELYTHGFISTMKRYLELRKSSLKVTGKP